MRVSVHGCGYLGAVHAAALARLGHEVVGIDVDPARVAALAEGRAPFFEPGLAALLADPGGAGSLTFSTDVAHAGVADVHFLCVGTPQSAGSGVADLQQLEAALAALRPHLRPGSVVVGKSTVPVGTAARLVTDLPDGVRLAWNPEFLREGHAVADTLHPDRLVYGVPDDGDALVERLDAVYARLLDDGVPRLVTDLATAELAKVAANAFLATKISFANAVAEVCEAAGGDAVALVGTMALDRRIGGEYLGVGLGFGGGCLPKDIRAFAARARELGVGPAVSFLDEVDAINDRCRERAVVLARTACGGSLAGRRVAVLGAAFKPDSDDVRSSPALALARALAAEGADVVVTDPQALALAQAAAPELGYAADVREAATGADVVVLATEWDEYRDLDPGALAEVVRSPRLVDARNAVDGARWRAAGWDVRSLGVAAPRAARGGWGRAAAGAGENRAVTTATTPTTPIQTHGTARCGPCSSWPCGALTWSSAGGVSPGCTGAGALWAAAAARSRGARRLDAIAQTRATGARRDAPEDSSRDHRKAAPRKAKHDTPSRDAQEAKGPVKQTNDAPRTAEASSVDALEERFSSLSMQGISGR